MSAALAPGTLLVAAPAMVDPNFEGTVVLLCIHEKEGSIGLVLNRPLPVAAQDVLPAAGLQGVAASELRWGGPVAPSQVFLLHEAPVSPDEGRLVAGGIHFGGGLESAQRIAASGGRVRFFAGYAGWGEGQLEQEFGEGGWFALPVDPAEVWDSEARWQWERLIARAEPGLGWMRQSEHPDAN